MQRRHRRRHLVAKEIEHRRLAGLPHLLLALRHRHEPVQVREQRAPIAEGVQRARLREALQRPLVHRFDIDAAAEVLDRRERPVLVALSDDALRRRCADVLDLLEAESDRRAILYTLARREVRMALVYRWRQDGDAEPRAFGAGGGDARLAARRVAARQREHGHHVLGRVVRLQVGRLIGDRRVADGVRLVERIPRERQDQLEDLLRLAFGVAVALGALDEVLALGVHHLRDLLAHRLAHDVRLAQRVVGELLRD